MRKIEIDESSMRLRTQVPPGFVGIIQTLTGQELPFSASTTVKVGDEYVTFHHALNGKIDAKFAMDYAKTLIDALASGSDGETGDTRFLEEWFDVESKLKEITDLGYQTWEIVGKDYDDGSVDMWGKGLQMDLKEIESIPAALAKLERDIPVIRKHFDALCARAEKERVL